MLVEMSPRYEIMLHGTDFYSHEKMPLIAFTEGVIAFGIALSSGDAVIVAAMISGIFTLINGLFLLYLPRRWAQQDANRYKKEEEQSIRETNLVGKSQVGVETDNGEEDSLGDGSDSDSSSHRTHHSSRSRHHPHKRRKDS